MTMSKAVEILKKAYPQKNFCVQREEWVFGTMKGEQETKFSISVQPGVNEVCSVVYGVELGPLVPQILKKISEGAK